MCGLLLVCWNWLTLPLQVVITRKALRGSVNDKGADLSSCNTPVDYDSSGVQRIWANADFTLRSVKTKNINLQTLLSQKSGTFLLEFYWRKGLQPKKCLSDFHVITGASHTALKTQTILCCTSNKWRLLCAVNCDRRYIFCNTLGIIPFSYVEDEESAETHRKICQCVFFIRSAHRVWLVGVRPPRPDASH